MQRRTEAKGISMSRADLLRLGGLSLAAALLVLTIFLPYWSITLHAPQYPKGLTINAFVHEMRGDVSEVDGLNHYIGMIKLETAASLERTVSRIAIPIIALLALLSFWVQSRWRWLLATPAIIYPVIFAIDLFSWLYYAGHALDPKAALSSSIHPFTPTILGTGIIGQFSTVASFGIGYYLAVLSAIIVLAVTIRGRSRDVSPS
ncbi:MAG TPA: cytochrome C [Thermomicrobiales bacterium]|nr:cytochrome C [Thermomicrobiales bacterium]HRA31029.1 cytochrome C [Thermomicrobiales bacterium]